jgi:hypothetical protein
MVENTPPSRFSSGFLGGLAQACAFMAAPFLTAGVGLGIAHMVSQGAAAGAAVGAGALLSWPVITGIFAIGAVFAAAAVIGNSRANKQRKYEQSQEVERCVEKAIEQHQPDLSMGQSISQGRERNWGQYVSNRRENEITRTLG